MSFLSSTSFQMIESRVDGGRSDLTSAREDGMSRIELRPALGHAYLITTD